MAAASVLQAVFSSTYIYRVLNRGRFVIWVKFIFIPIFHSKTTRDFNFIQFHSKIISPTISSAKSLICQKYPYLFGPYTIKFISQS